MLANSKGREYRGFRPYAGGEKPGTKEYYKYGMQDYERMEGLCRGDWQFVGIHAEAKIRTKSGMLQTIRSGGLWGIESDCDDAIREVAQEQIDDLRDELCSFNFGKRKIDTALRDVEIPDGLF